ncbi:MAG: hypothetical protein EKK63_13835 [Acinetobacter sp.]|uniref:hypothetical protein n=1 Tax=Acinetobacter sp. TaxID=472 RepID=UPI000FA6E00C|nr:hypothetical protein [Acinetobacter sp.]RUP37982.1 MAG: hypothetical protein EKK63_13835 [Acinetobacter sp.]
MDAFTKAYITAMFFTELGEDNLKDAGLPEISTELMEKIEKDCAEFQAKAGELISDEFCHYKECPTIDYAGHDFWLTRNHHGCGFWEKHDWAEPASTKLTELAHSFGQMDVYLGDDGKIYAM